MGLLDLLRKWTTLPDAESAGYACWDCSTAFNKAEPACPECGGEVEVSDHGSVELYWPHH